MKNVLQYKNETIKRKASELKRSAGFYFMKGDERSVKNEISKKDYAIFNEDITRLELKNEISKNDYSIFKEDITRLKLKNENYELDMLTDKEVLMYILNSFKNRMREVDKIMDSKILGELLEKYFLIENLFSVFMKDNYYKVLEAQDMNNLEFIEIYHWEDIETISKFKESFILSYINDVDEVKDLYKDIKPQFLKLYLNVEDKSVFYEYFKKQKRPKNGVWKCYYSLATFSEFRPNIDFELNDLINTELSKILTREKFMEEYEERRKEIEKNYPNFLTSKKLQFITNIKSVNIFGDNWNTLILDYLTSTNFEFIFNSYEFFRFVLENADAENYSIVIVVHDNHELNFKFNIELPLEFKPTKNKVFTIRYLSLKNLILETKAKLYGINVENLSEFKEMKTALLNSNLNNSNKNIEYLVRKNLYLNNIELYKNSVFIFKHLSHTDVKTMFNWNNIIISSGINKSKGLINTLELRMFNFLNSIYPKFSLYKIIKKSFQKSRLNLPSSLSTIQVYEDYILCDDIKTLNFKLIWEKDKEEKSLKLVKVNADKDSKIEPNEDKNISIKKTNSDSLEFNKNLKHSGCLLSSNKINLNQNGREFSTLTSTSSSFLSILSKKNKFESSDNNRNGNCNVNSEVYNFSINENKNDFIMDKYSSIIKDKNLSKEEKQLKIEKFWVEFQQYFKGLDENIAKEFPHSILNIVIKVNNTLQLKYDTKILGKKFPSIYLNLNKIELLLITLFLAVRLITINKNNWTNICSLVGKKILYHMYCEKIKIKAQNDLDQIYESYKAYTFDKYLEDMSINDFNLYSIKLGDFFLELFCQEPHVILEKFYGYSNESGVFEKKELNLKVKIKPSYFKNFSENILIDHTNIPMICKPKLWSDSQRGGYLLEDYTNENIITGSKNQGHQIKSKAALYETINYLSQLEFSVNNEFLDFLNSSKGQALLTIDSKKSESEIIQINTNIKLAQIFRNESFYLPLRGDFRGRVYVNSFFLNYQGSDLSKALIQFTKGKKLNKEGLNYLYIFGAKLYNFNSIDKENHQNRIDWVKSNLNHIYDMDFNFIKNAENIWSFISFCLVMKQFKKDPNYEVRLPIYIDATCSGIQHIAGMIKDLDIAKNVNLIPQLPEDKVSDIYTTILDIVNKEIKEIGNKENSDFPKFKHLILNRKDIKNPVMTKTYNVTLLGMKNQLVVSLGNRTAQEVVNIKNIKKNIVIKSYLTEELIELESKDIIKIAQIIESKIFKTFPLLEMVYSYFKSVCKLMNNIGLPIIWFTPSGLEITQNYFKFKSVKVGISFAGKTKKLVLNEWTKELNKRSQMGALIPNVVHSLDASHLMEVIKKVKYSNIDYVLPVHDCFGTHPNDLPAVYDIIKWEFIQLYSNIEFLNSFHENNLDFIKKNKFDIVKKNKKLYVKLKVKNTFIPIPEIPKPGKLDLESIKFSRYMFN